MFVLSVAFGPDGKQWSFAYKNKGAAQDTYDAIIATAGTIAIADDYGQSASFSADQVHGVLFEDLDLSAEAAIERGLHQARTQARGQNKAQQDPVIKAASLAQGFGQVIGPGIGRG